MTLRYVLYGIIIGIANIIPGVSGGTMAVILNVYDKIIYAVSNITKDFIKSAKFLLPIGIGAGIGILLFSKVIEFALEYNPAKTNMAFIGLIIGSIPMIYKSATKNKLTTSAIFSFVVALSIMFLTILIEPLDSAGALITTLTAKSFITLFLASVVAAAAMIIPGISGSFIMLILGTYTSVITAISSFNILILIPVALGCAVGILGCAKIIDKLFQSYPDQTYSAILGFMIGSIFVIFPPLSVDRHGLLGVLIACFTAYLAYSFSKR